MYLFVYDNLKVGRGNHRLISELVDSSHLDHVSGFTLYQKDGIPYAVQTGDDRYITGDVLHIMDENSAEVLKRVDLLQGYGHLYNRVKVYTLGFYTCSMYIAIRPDTWGGKVLGDVWK